MIFEAVRMFLVSSFYGTFFPDIGLYIYIFYLQIVSSGFFPPES